jgi:hypothetical protein
MPFTAYQHVHYVDEDGYQMGWVYRRFNQAVHITAPDAVLGHWTEVDNDYPKNVDDAINELVALGNL